MLSTPYGLLENGVICSPLIEINGSGRKVGRFPLGIHR